MPVRKSAFAVELIILAIAAPALYFPNWFPAWASWLSLVSLGAGWLYRKRQVGVWFVRTPADWPVFFLFLIMLPMAVAVTPGELRQDIAVPRAYILVWNFCLFWWIVTYASRHDRAFRLLFAGFAGLSTLIACIAPFGMNWLYKVPALAGALEQVPSLLVGVFKGAESGFSPNQVAGSLLYFLPLCIGLLMYDTKNRFSNQWLLLLLCTLAMLFVLLLTQSRAAMLGLICGLAVMVALPTATGRRVLLFGMGAVVLTLPLWFDRLMSTVGDAAPDIMIGSASTLNVRFEIWRHALYGIADFPFSGLGLGTFRAVVRPLYGLISVPPEYDIAHAHNVFLQSALDMGLPGLIALLAIYMAVAVQIYVLWKRGAGATVSHRQKLTWNAWALGFAASLISQTVYSQLDAVALGSKPSLLFWALIALVFAAVNLAGLGDPEWVD